MKSLLFVFFLSLNSLTTFGSNVISYENREKIYTSIDFKGNQVDQNVFNLALRGYIKLRDNHELQNENILAIIDYSKHANEKRFWVIDLSQRTVLYNELVSHGKNTGGEYASQFSNQPDSKQSSLGFFTTGKVYNGKHDFSLKLHGKEEYFNSNAFQRGIVIHGADYVSEDYITTNYRIGRSYGCPAIRQEIKYELIDSIKDGACLFIYYPSDDYLLKSTYLTVSN